VSRLRSTRTEMGRAVPRLLPARTVGGRAVPRLRPARTETTGAVWWFRWDRRGLRGWARVTRRTGKWRRVTGG